MISNNDLGYFGNIWVRQNELLGAGTVFGGHKHHFDHVTLLVSGKIEVEVSGYLPKQFTGPTFIVIRKQHEHKITALTDNVVFYCVFALRDINGEVMDDIYSGAHDPLSAAADLTGYAEASKKLEILTHEFDVVS